MRKITKRESCFASLLVSFELSTLGQKKKNNKAKSKTQVSCNCGGKQRHYVEKEMMTYPGTRILVLGFCLLLDSGWLSQLSQVSILRAALCPKLRVANCFCLNLSAYINMSALDVAKTWDTFETRSFLPVFLLTVVLRNNALQQICFKLYEIETTYGDEITLANTYHDMDSLGFVWS